jgi:hypothetical protein
MKKKYAKTRQHSHLSRDREIKDQPEKSKMVMEKSIALYFIFMLVGSWFYL